MFFPLDIFSEPWHSGFRMNTTTFTIPTPRKFRLKYRTSANETKDYEISNPISKTDKTFTAYAFGRGIRSFRLDQILDIVAI